jgi:hypothetical protein
LNYDLLFINGEYYYLNSKAEKNKKWIVGKCKCKSTICYLEKNFKSTYVNSENCQLFIFSGQENSNEFIVCLCIVCEARYLSFNSYKGIKYLNDNSYPLFDHMSLTRVAHRSHRDAQKKLLGAASEKLVIEALGELGRQALDGYEYFYLLSCDKKETVLTNFFYFGFDGLFPESWTVNINDNDRIMIYSAIKDIEDLEVQGFFEYIGNVFNRNNKNVEFKSAVVTLLDIKNDRYVLIYLKKDAKSLHTNERTILETISPILEDTIRRIETHSDKDIISLNDRYHNTSFCCDYNFEIYLCRQVEYMAKMINASNGHIYLYDCVSNLLYYAGGFKVNEDQIENNTYLEVDSNSLVAQAIDSGSSIFSKLYSGEYFLVNGSKVPYNFLLDLDEAISIPIHDEKNKRNLWGVVTFGFESNKANKENVEKVVSDYEHFMTAEYCDILNIKSYQLESLLKDVLLNLSLGASYLTKRAFDEICSAIASVSKCESVSIRIYDLISNCLVRKGGYGPESMQSSLYAEPLDSVSSYAFNNYKIYNSIYIPNTKERSSYSKYNNLKYLKTRENTLSELCLPLVVDGARGCVGTVNLESTKVNYFVFTKQILESVAPTIVEFIDKFNTHIEYENRNEIILLKKNYYYYLHDQKNMLLKAESHIINEVYNNDCCNGCLDSAVKYLQELNMTIMDDVQAKGYGITKIENIFSIILDRIDRLRIKIDGQNIKYLFEDNVVNYRYIPNFDELVFIIAVDNIINNAAAQFKDNNINDKEFKVVASNKGEQVLFEFIDSGFGFSEENRDCFAKNNIDGVKGVGLVIVGKCFSSMCMTPDIRITDNSDKYHIVVTAKGLCSE